MWIPMEIMQHILIFLSKAQKKLAREQRKLSHCEQGVTVIKSKRRKWHGSIPISHISEKGFLHKESRKIANSYDIVLHGRSEYEKK